MITPGDTPRALSIRPQWRRLAKRPGMPGAQPPGCAQKARPDVPAYVVSVAQRRRPVLALAHGGTRADRVAQPDSETEPRQAARLGR